MKHTIKKLTLSIAAWACALQGYSQINAFTWEAEKVASNQNMRGNNVQVDSIQISPDSVARRVVLSYPFSDSVPISPDTPAYTATPLYGGVQVTIWNTNQTSFNSQVFQTSGAGDFIHLQVVPSSVASWHSVFFFKKEDFMNGADKMQLTLDDSSSLSIVFTGLNSDQQCRWLLIEDGKYYLSEATFTSNNISSTLKFPSATNHGRWAEYFPEDSIRFDAAQATFTDRLFTNITGVGFATNVVNGSSGNRRLQVRGFTAILAEASFGLQSPLANTIISQGDTLNFKPQSLPGGTSSVKYYIQTSMGTELLGTSSDAPFEFTSPKILAPGASGVYAVALFNGGADSVTSPLTPITVNNLKPTVSITSPVENQVLSGPMGTIHALSIDASSEYNTITSVKIIANGSEATTLTAEPYQYDWIPQTAGNYTLTAIAYDDMGDSTISNPVNVAVDFTTGYGVTISHKAVTVYPNPANQSVTIDYEGGGDDKLHMRMFTLSGIELLNVMGSISDVNAALNNRLTTAEAGMYMVQVHINDKITTFKLFKE